MQLVEEVERNKLKVAADFLKQQIKELRAPKIEISTHLFDPSEVAAAKLPDKFKEISRGIEDARASLEKAADRTLQQISRSEDEVSKALVALFKNPIQHTSDELHRAKERKERGNPPGKHGDPLGDQLIWEQLISRFKPGWKLWIITKDSDYCITYGEQIWLNPFVYQDLVRIGNSAPEVYCFNNVGDGLKHFVKTTGVPATKLPTDDESKEIKREIESLPPVGSASLDWMYPGVMPPNVRSWEPWIRQQQIAAIAASNAAL